MTRTITSSLPKCVRRIAIDHSRLRLHLSALTPIEQSSRLRAQFKKIAKDKSKKDKKTGKDELARRTSANAALQRS